MRICQYIPHGAIPDTRGFAPAIVAQMFYKYFPENIEHYFVSNLENHTTKAERTEFGKVFRIGESPLYRRLFRKITKLDPYPLYKRLAKIINANPVDILHIHQLEFPIHKFKKLLKDKNIKIIIHIHAIREFNPALGIADKYLAVSNYTKNQLVKNKGFPDNLVDVVYNGVDTELFKVQDNILYLKRKFNIDINDIIITYIGRKQQQKGFYSSLLVYEKLLQTYHNITVIAVGPTPESELRQKHYQTEGLALIEKLEKYPKFINLPSLTHDKLSKIYQIADIILFPTFFIGEQHPLVALEAIASNNILISTNDFSLPEIITHNASGLLLDNPQDIDEIMQKIEYAINNINHLTTMREQAREMAVNTFDWQISTNKLVKIYQNTLGE